MLICLEHARVFDGQDVSQDTDGYVIVEDERIVEVGAGRPPAVTFQRRLDCGGGFLMPGLIDAHFHAYSPSFNISGNDRMTPQLLALHARRVLEGTLKRGFTTVRDAAGGDLSLWLAIEQGLIRGPRFFYSGKALSQTGGHGDMRNPGEIEPCGCTSYSGSITRVVDGVDAVRQAAREELRKGAHQIKIFVSGGGLSPSDPMWMPQFTDAEISAAVEEAATRRTYVMAHCHTDDGARRCVENGVRSIEHGTLINRDSTAAMIASAGAFVVPTLSVAHVLMRHASALGIPPASVAKIEAIGEQMFESIDLCRQAGVQLGFGTDLLDHLYHVNQGGEFELRGRVSPAIEVLRSATSVNARLMGQAESIGSLRAGLLADLVLIDGDPVADLGIMGRPERMPLVIRGGQFIRNLMPTVEA